MRKRDEDDLYKFYQNNKVRSFSNCNTNWIEVIKEKWLSNDNENEENTEIGDCSFGALKMSILEGDKSISVKKCSPHANTTKEIALSLGIEQDQSSVSRLSSILTPVTSKFHNTSVLKTSPEVIAKNASCGKNESVLGKLSKSCSSPELATELTKDSLSSEMSENHRPSTQGFNIVGMRALQEICKESLTGLATPEAAKYSHEKNSKNDNSLPITSTPLSHFKSISKKTIYNRSKFESGLYFKPLNSPIHSSENGRFNQRLRFESQENLSVSGIDENFSNVLEFSKSSQGKKTETSHEHKFSRLSLKKKKKFVYPSIEEEVNEELALKSEILSKSTDNLNPVMEEGNKKIKLSIKQVGFKSASILKESIVEDCSRINVKNPIPKAEMFEEFDVQEKSCIFGSELCKSVVQSESIVCGKKTTCMDEIKCDNLKDKINDLDMLEIKICSSSDRGDEKYLKIKNKENMDTLETENIKSMKAKHSVQSDLSVSSVSGLRYGKTGAFSFPGFQSAAGKKVNVNSDALLKAKALLNDEQNYETEPLGKNDDLLCNSYITGEDEIKDAIQINTNSPVETLAKHVNKENQTLSEFSFPMFQSASGSKINISSEALKKTKVIMDEACDDELELNQQGKKSNFTGGKYKETYESSQPSTSQIRNVLTSPCSTLIEEKTGLSTPNFPGFQSAAGKKINVSMKALQKAKFILDELENNKDETEARECGTAIWDDEQKDEADLHRKHEDLISNSDITGKNDKKTIQIKTSSSLKTLTNHVNMENRSSSEFSVPRFQSASGSKIKVSSEALERAKVIMDEAELNRQGEKISNFTNGKNEHTYEKSRPSTSQVERVLTSPLTLIEERTGLSTPNFVGFQSAAGKKINVSVKALQKAKSILDELENNKNETKAPEFEMAILSEASASDTSIINEELNFMAAVKLPKFNNNNNNNGFMKAVFPGLYSASGKKINVSSEALEKAKAILDDEADELNNDDKAEKKEKVFSPLKFKTANNKNVIISPSSLLKVKSMFDNCHTEGNGDKHEYEAVSPVLGSQKYRKNSQKRSLQEDDFASLQKTVKMLKRDFEENDERDEDDMLDVHENMEINEATRAFLLDSSWDETYSVQVEREELVRRKLELIERKMKDGIKCENNEGGSLFRFKISHKENRVQLSDLSLSKKFLTDDTSALHCTSKNCGAFRFEINSRSVKVDFEDGLEIVPGNDGKIGWREIEIGFLSASNIRSSALPSTWVKNHFSLIVWKLASLQRRMGHNFQNRIFTLEEVVRQIRFRYDIEVLEGKRSVLRKIYEQDDTPRKTMILCVFDILKNEQNPNSKTTENESSDSYTLTLTDGWYIIESQIDSAMISLITKKKIKIGMKLLIHGAELIASPSPCHPLQMAKDGVTLKIHTNMCRLSAWHSKLGLFKKVGVPSSTVLSAILDDGGIVGSLTGILCRRYPVAFLEKRDNRTTFVNERVYEARKRTSEIEQESLMEKLYDQVEKELEKDERTKWNNSISLNNRSVESLADGEEICGLIEQTYDASVIQGLSEEQIQLAKNCREEVIIKQRQKINKEVKLRAKKLQEIYQAVPVLKLGVRDKNGKEAVITVWRPHEEILSLQEGKTFSFHYLSSSATRFNVKHLSWTKQSFIKNSEASLSPFKSSQYVISEYSNITSSYLDEVPFHEIDVVGVVVKVLDVKDEAQNVYLTDVDHNFIVLRFSPSIIDFQYQDAIQKGRIICAVNCNWRNQYFNGFYVLNVTPFTHISSAIQKHNDSVMKLVNKMKDPSFVSDAERKLDDLCLNNCNQEYCSDLPSVDGTGCSLNTPKLKSSLYSLSVLSRPFRTPIRHQKNNS